MIGLVVEVVGVVMVLLVVEILPCTIYAAGYGNPNPDNGGGHLVHNPGSSGDAGPGGPNAGGTGSEPPICRWRRRRIWW